MQRCSKAMLPEITMNLHFAEFKVRCKSLMPAQIRALSRTNTSMSEEDERALYSNIS